MRVLFLDVDGVLNRIGFLPPPAAPDGLAGWIEPELGARLAALVHETDVEVVVSSSWREDHTVAELRAELALAGIDVRVIDVTPFYLGEPRWAEIAAWLRVHRPSHFVIIDDEPDMGPLAAHHVCTDVLTGLDAAAAAAARAVLQRPAG